MTGFKQNSGDDLDALSNEVLFEFVTIGNAVRVSAVHVATNTEIVLMGSPTMSAYTLKANAVRKLRAALVKRASGA